MKTVYLLLLLFLSSACALTHSENTKFYWYRFECDEEHKVRIQVTYNQLRNQPSLIYDKVEELCADPANYIKEKD